MYSLFYHFTFFLLMAVSTAASAAFFVVMVVFASVATAFASVTVMMSATAASACQMLDQVLYFILSGLTVLYHGSSEVQCLASQGMVGVEGDAIFLDFQDFGHETVVFVVHQGDDGTFVDIVVVEMTVDHERLPAQFMNTFRVVCSECVSGLQGEVERCAALFLDQLLLEGV